MCYGKKVPCQKVYKSKGPQVQSSTSQYIGPQVRRATSQKVPSQKVYKSIG